MKEKWFGARITAPRPGTFSDRDRPRPQEGVGVQRGHHPHGLVDPFRFAAPDTLVEAVEVLLRPRVPVDLLAHRHEVVLLAHPVRSTSLGRQGYAPPPALALWARIRSSSWRARWANPAGVRPLDAVAQRQLHLDHARARASRVDRHPQLHPVPAGERQQAPQQLTPERPLAAERRTQLEPAARGDRPPAYPPRDPEAAPLALAEGSHRQLRPPVPHAGHQRAELAARESPRSPSQSRNSSSRRSSPGPAARRRQRHPRGGAHRGSLAGVAGTRDDACAGRPARAAVASRLASSATHSSAPRQRPPQGHERRLDARPLVAGGHDHLHGPSTAGGARRASAAVTIVASPQLSVPAEERCPTLTLI